MQQYESFGDCLRRCLKEMNMSATAAAELVGFKSRNSIFRILSGEASCDVKLRFLEAFHERVNTQWPDERWQTLEDALRVERLGPVRYQSNLAFQRLLHEPEPPIMDYYVQCIDEKGESQESLLAEMLEEIAALNRVEIIITGCCESGICRLLAKHCSDAGQRGTLSIRHYIDISENTITRNILGIMPLVSKPWYNARLVEPGSCPPEMMAIYRVNAIHIHAWDEHGQQYGQRLMRYDETHFAAREPNRGICAPVAILDRWRFHLELLKPVAQFSDGIAVVMEYTAQNEQLEENCMILSIKPDVHICCIAAETLDQAVLDGAMKSGKTADAELIQLVQSLNAIQNRRIDNIFNKRRPTHLVYTLPMMERFMRTGRLTDRFFDQRAYTVEERRQIIRGLLDAMRNKPYFNVHFLRAGAPELHYEITYFEGKGVMLMDADPSIALDKERSQALITLPAFMESFKHYFMDELLVHYVLPRAETLRHLERLLVMNLQE